MLSGVSSRGQGRTGGEDLGTPIRLKTDATMLKKQGPEKCDLTALIIGLAPKRNVNRRKNSRIRSQIPR